LETISAEFILKWRKTKATEKRAEWSVKLSYTSYVNRSKNETINLSHLKSKYNIFWSCPQNANLNTFRSDLQYWNDLTSNFYIKSIIFRKQTSQNFVLLFCI
jgi:hypothetical protein